MRTKVAVIAVALAVSGCVNISESEIALSKNVYQIDLSARGRFGVDAAPKRAQIRAAELTLQKGYSHYVIQSGGTSGGSVYAGQTPVYSQTNVNVVGNTAYASTNNFGGYPMMMPTSQTSITVVMFNSKDAPPNALDAAQVLKNLKK